MSNPISTVGSFGAPLSGVKRPALGAPTTVPKGLPAFRGKKIPAGGDIKVPGLKPGNRQNEGTNIRIPNARITPLEFLSTFCGRVSPGDVAFVQRVPIGFAGEASLRSSANGGRGGDNPNDYRRNNGQQTVNRVIGIDGLNRLLHGTTAPGGWVEGINVFRGPNAGDVVRNGNRRDDLYRSDPRFAGAVAQTTKVPDELAEQREINAKRKANGQLEVPDPTYKREDDFSKKGNFRISLLNDYTCDGVIISNDEPESFTSNGARDATVFNIAIQGPTLCNNGYLAYNGSASLGANGLRSVEAYPRGCLETEMHQRQMTTNAINSKGGSPWLPNEMYDFVSAFTGSYTNYPTQMFDRHLQPLDTIYVGIRAFLLDPTKVKINNVDGTDNPVAALTGDDSFWFFQLMPFASRKAWLVTQMDEALALPDTDPDRDRAIRRISTDSAGPASRNVLKTPFDEHPFDAVRSVDIHNMVGAYKVGRVLDIKAMRYSAYDGGPADTGHALNVDVQVAWQPSLPMAGVNPLIAYVGDPAIDGTVAAQQFRQDRVDLYRVSQPSPSHPAYTNLTAFKSLTNSANTTLNPTPLVADVSNNVFSYDSTDHIPAKRLRRVEAQLDRPSLQQTLGSAIGKRWKPIEPTMVAVNTTVRLDSVTFTYKRMNTIESDIAWTTLISLVGRDNLRALSKKALDEKRYDDIKVAITTIRRALWATTAPATKLEERKRVLRLLRLPYTAVGISKAEPTRDGLDALLKSMDNDGDTRIDKKEFNSYFAVAVGGSADKDFGPDLSKEFGEMQDESIGAATAQEIAEWARQDAALAAAQLAATPAPATAAATPALDPSASLDAEVAAALAEPPVGLPEPLVPTPVAASAAATAAKPGKAPARKTSPARTRPAAATGAPAAAAPESLGVAAVPAASQPARARSRPTTSMVASVFDSLYNVGAEEPQAPASPGSRSSGSEQSAGAGGPSTFQRRRR